MEHPKLTFSRLDHADAELLDRYFQRRDRMLEVCPGRVILPADYTPVGQEILDLEVLDDDVWLCSYPRTAFWNRRDDPNLLFIKYEEMKRDLPSIIRKVATFLGKELTDSQMDQLCEHLSFENMKTNKAVNLEPIIEKALGKDFQDQSDKRFIRKGQIGDWKNHMSEDLSRRFDEWAEQNLKGTGLAFD